MLFRSQFFTQKLSIPSISASQVEVATPFNKMFSTPDKLMFANLDLTFIVDEEMKNYLEIYDWMNGIAHPRDFTEFKKVDESQHGLESDITVLVVNSHKNPNMEVSFINCFPISLSEIMMDTTNQDVIYPECVATFQYQSFSIKSVARTV